MVRLTWLFLAVWCASLAQVPPVAPLLAGEGQACCGGACECGGACGRPECALAPMPVPPTAEPADTLSVRRPAAAATKLPPAPPAVACFALLLPPLHAAADPPAPPGRAPLTAPAPLFQRDCSWLL